MNPGCDFMSAKYIQMANALRTAISEGEYKSASRLPTEQQLMQQFSVSRQTVRNALEILTKEGLISVGKAAAPWCWNRSQSLRTIPSPLSSALPTATYSLRC